MFKSGLFIIVILAALLLLIFFSGKELFPSGSYIRKLIEERSSYENS